MGSRVLHMSSRSSEPQTFCKTTLLYGNCMTCTNLHILLRTAEKHHLEHLAASAQAWGASPNLQYGELFDTHRMKEKKSKSKGARKQEVDSICTIIHKRLLLFAVQFCLSPILPAFTACILTVSSLSSPVHRETLPKGSVYSAITLRTAPEIALKITKLAEI